MWPTTSCSCFHSLPLWWSVPSNDEPNKSFLQLFLPRILSQQWEKQRIPSQAHTPEATSPFLVMPRASYDIHLSTMGKLSYFAVSMGTHTPEKHKCFCHTATRVGQYKGHGVPWQPKHWLTHLCLDCNGYQLCPQIRPFFMKMVMGSEALRAK